MEIDAIISMQVYGTQRFMLQIPGEKRSPADDNVLLPLNVSFLLQ